MLFFWSPGPFIVVLTIPGCILSVFMKWETVLTVPHSHVFLCSCLFYVLFFHWSCPQGGREWEQSSPNPCSTWCVHQRELPTQTHRPKEMKFICILNLIFKIFCPVEYLYMLWCTSTVLNYLSEEMCRK